MLHASPQFKRKQTNAQFYQLGDGQCHNNGHFNSYYYLLLVLMFNIIITSHLLGLSTTTQEITHST